MTGGPVPHLDAAHRRWTSDLPTPAVALAIGAHPDDVEFGCGATLAKWAAAGCVVHHLVLTDGSKGTWDPGVDPTHLIAVRRDEQRAAAAELGATGECHFLHHTDGELEASLDARSEVARVIRATRPNVVVGHDPWKRYRLHPDHRAAGFLTVDGVVAARDPHFFPEHRLAPWRPESILLFEADEPDHVEDVTAHLDTKIAALLRHTSQLRSTMGIDEDDDGTQRDAFVERIRARSDAAGEHIDVEFGEAFTLLPTDR